MRYLYLVLLIALAGCAIGNKRRLEYITSHPALSPKIKEQILVGKISLGNMTVEQAKRRLEYITSHPNLSPQMEEKILTGKISLGMTAEQVTASWGKPWIVNRTVYSEGVSEQWSYSYYSFPPYLYFENNILTHWQDSTSPAVQP